MIQSIVLVIWHILQCLPKLFSNHLVAIALLEKENQILRRAVTAQRIRSTIATPDRFAVALLAWFGKLLGTLKATLVSPHTLLAWQRALFANRWTFASQGKKPGRPATSADIVALVIDMKNDNPLWGSLRIESELKKIDIALDHATIARIISNARKTGKIKPALTWSKFLKAQAASLFACDFFTIDTITGSRLYCFFIIAIASRRIIACATTAYPTRQFVRQQIILFSEKVPGTKHLIHDNGPELCSLDYSDYGIKDVRTAVKAPNMNAFAERFVRSVRTECLDWFLVVSQRQATRLVTDYVTYYNAMRPHQGIGLEIPDGYRAQSAGRIKSAPVLGGLHRHYYRLSA